MFSPLITQTAKSIAGRVIQPAGRNLTNSITHRMKSSKQTGGRRENCLKDEGPRCGKVRLAKTDCAKDREKATKKTAEQTKESPLKSMWYNPDCCNNPCADMLPRFDELYYHITDKTKAKYQRTWAECPEMKILPKKVCSFEKLSLPPMEKRSRNDRPTTACHVEDSCKSKKNTKCEKIHLPRCRRARDPPKCHTERSPADCKKVCAPYPSFSECKRPKMKPLRPIECECLKVHSMCTAFAYLRKMEQYKKV